MAAQLEASVGFKANMLITKMVITKMLITKRHKMAAQLEASVGFKHLAVDAERKCAELQRQADERHGHN